MDLSKTAIMAILNVNEESFYGQSRVKQKDALRYRVDDFVLQGADMLDIGAQSTRPHATLMSEQEELDAVLESLETVNSMNQGLPISIDTFRPKVAREALSNGAHMINDVTGGDFDNTMFDVVAEYGVPYCLTHSMGMPDVMQSKTDEYEDFLTDIFDSLMLKKKKLLSKGIHDVIIDVGFGFGKSVEQNYLLLKHLPYFRTINSPILVGVSRKSFLSKSTNSDPNTNLGATIAAQTLAVQSGACQILRVHDVLECRQLTQVVRLYQNT